MRPRAIPPPASTARLAGLERDQRQALRVEGRASLRLERGALVGELARMAALMAEAADRIAEIDSMLGASVE